MLTSDVPIWVEDFRFRPYIRVHVAASDVDADAGALGHEYTFNVHIPGDLPFYPVWKLNVHYIAS